MALQDTQTLTTAAMLSDTSTICQSNVSIFCYLRSFYCEFYYANTAKLVLWSRGAIKVHAALKICLCGSLNVEE